MDKYKLSKETKEVKGTDFTTFYRIQAIKDIPSIGVKAGDLGGWVMGTHNLSQKGDCWIFDNAQVTGNAFVRDNAQVRNNATLSHQACASGNAVISHNASLSESAIATDKCTISENVQVWGHAIISEGVTLFGSLKVYGHARIEGFDTLFGSATFISNALIKSSNDYIHIDGVFTAFKTSELYREDEFIKFFGKYASSSAYTAKNYRKHAYAFCYSNSTPDTREKLLKMYNQVDKGIEYALQVLN